MKKISRLSVTVFSALLIWSAPTKAYYAEEGFFPVSNDYINLAFAANRILFMMAGHMVHAGRGGGDTTLGYTGHPLNMPNGMSAGDGFNPSMTGAWANYSYSSIENDFISTRYDGHSGLLLGGVDFAPSDKVLIGIAIGYEKSSIDTDFNLGSADSDGFTVAPYMGVTINDTWSMDFAAGYSKINTDQERLNGTVTSDADTLRMFVAGNLNAYVQKDNWVFTGRAGAMHAYNRNDAFVESIGTTVASNTIKVTQVSLGGEAAYPMDNMEPYVGLTYTRDIMATKVAVFPQPKHDKDDILIAGGVRFYNKSGLNGSLDISKRVGRANYDEASISFTLRWDF